MTGRNSERNLLRNSSVNRARRGLSYTKQKEISTRFEVCNSILSCRWHQTLNKVISCTVIGNFHFEFGLLNARRERNSESPELVAANGLFDGNGGSFTVIKPTLGKQKGEIRLCDDCGQ